MKVIIHTSILDKTLYALGVVCMIWGIYDIYQEYPEDRMMPLAWQWKYYPLALLLGGVLMLIPYQFKAMREIMKFRPYDHEDEDIRK